MTSLRERLIEASSQAHIDGELYRFAKILIDEVVALRGLAIWTRRRIEADSVSNECDGGETRVIIPDTIDNVAKDALSASDARLRSIGVLGE